MDKSNFCNADRIYAISGSFFSVIVLGSILEQFDLSTGTFRIGLLFIFICSYLFLRYFMKQKQL